MKLIEMNAIHQAMKLITKSVTVTRQRVQDMAEQACAYSIIHGDISVGVKLLEAVGVNKSLRRDSLVAYFEKYGNFCWLKADKKLAFFAAHDVGALTDEQAALIQGAKWDEAKRETEPVSKYDMEDALRKFIGKLHKITQDANITVEHRDALQVVENAFAKWSAENCLKSMKVDETIVQEGAQVEAVVAARTELVEVAKAA
jgi:hypothetical protein